MSNHWQLHAMTSLYAPLIMKPKSANENSVSAIKTRDIRKKFQDHLSIKDDSLGQPVNNVNPTEWVITNLAFPVNYLPQGTTFKHISFIPTNIPDFRKVELSANDYTEPDSNTLKSTTVKSRMHDTINKHEIKSMLTSITGKPVINYDKTIDDVESKNVLATSIAQFLMSNSSEGTNDFNANELRLQIARKIKDSNLKPDIETHVSDSIDQAFNEIDTGKLIANVRKADDTVVYILEKLLFK